MITSIRLENFKNFADETPRLGPFTVIVGANAFRLTSLASPSIRPRLIPE